MTASRYTDVAQLRLIRLIVTAFLRAIQSLPRKLRYAFGGQANGANTEQTKSHYK